MSRIFSLSNGLPICERKGTPEVGYDLLMPYQARVAGSVLQLIELGTARKVV